MTQVLTTADGVPLKTSLHRTLRRRKITALLLVAPLFVFIMITFLFPIADMLVRSFDNSLVPNVLHRTVPLLAKWDEKSGQLPGEEVFAALVLDFKEGQKNYTINRLGKRLNYEKSGMSSLFRKTARKVKRLKEVPSYKEALLKIDKKWKRHDVWFLLKLQSGSMTPTYFYAAVDAHIDDTGKLTMKPVKQQIYLNLFVRTLLLSLLITVITIVLGYPIAYLLATLPTKKSNMLIILVLLPFWTSLLVRTSAWIALLQREGVINDLLVWMNIISADNRLQMIHNQVGTVVAMSHVLLPFMVLPLFSVMKTIPPSYMRAAQSMGATPYLAFRRIYFPNTIPGIGAGSILVFILAIGYYITPALVGGTQGTFISNFIAYHISNSLNWGLGAALGAILLAIVLVLYVAYDKMVGINNMKLG